MFARRTEWDLTPNKLSRKLAELRGRGEEILDLTESNPTRVGLQYPDGLLKELADPRGLLYEPDPRGLLAARKTVASIYAAKGTVVDPERIFLTASTSEAYSMLFRFLADPGEQVLVPRPSYPLFGYLAGLNDLETVSYPLHLDGDLRWRVGLEEIEEAMTARTRVLVVVHPNNPTGSCLTEEERSAAAALCARRGAAMICDEVFAEYLHPAGRQVPATLLRGDGPLTFALGGLSKWMGLPQMKLSWIACAGPAPQVSGALARLEVIADTSLSVNTPVQAAFPRWAALTPSVQRQIRERVQTNRGWLKSSLPPPVRLLPADGGWSAVLKIPSMKDEESWVLELLERHRVLAHPGYFYDFEQPGIAVVSLLPPPARFQQGIGRLLANSVTIGK